MEFLLSIFSILFLRISDNDSILERIKNPEFVDQKEEIEFSEEIKITRFEYYYENKSSSKIIVYQIPSNLNIKFINDSENPKTIKEWGNEISKNSEEFIIINGFYFDENDNPSGYLKIDDQILSNNYLTAESVGAIFTSFGTKEEDPETQFTNYFDIKTSTESYDFNQTANGGQSFPFLLIDGKNPISKDSGKFARRSFIGEDQAGNIYLGIIPNSKPSLYQTGEYLENLNQQFDLEISNILNLDGGPSSGLIIQTGEFEEILNSQAKVPSIILVEEN